MRSLLFVVAIVLATGTCVVGAEHWTDRYDVEWHTPSEKPMDSMPFGGGDLGCNVWVENGELLLYVQKAGSFNELGEYVKLGRFRITLSPNPFTESDVFSQKLNLEDGSVTIQTTGRGEANGFEAKLRCWVDVFTRSVHVQIDAAQPVDYQVRFETWRDKDYPLIEPDSRHPNMGKSPRWNSYSLVAYPGEVLKLKDEFRYEGNSILFYHRNPEDPMIPRIGLEQQGLTELKDQIYNGNKNLTFGGRIFAEGAVPGERGEGRYLFDQGFSYMSLKSAQPAVDHHIMIATHRAQGDDWQDWKRALDQKCDMIKASKGDREKNAQWWSDFWERSHVIIDPDRKHSDETIWKIGRNYQLGRYQFGCNFYGDSPTKFNGGSFSVDPGKRSFDPDWRPWGGDFHTAQNQRLIYWPMLKMGDAEAMHPQFQLYLRGLAGASARVKHYFGHEGAVYCENTSSSGINLPLAWCWPPNDYSPDKRIRPEKEVPFGDPRIKGFTKGIVEYGNMHNASIGYHFTSQLEHSFMILEYHRYTGESIDEYLPFIEQALIFFDQHYQKRQMLRNGEPFDARGKLVLYPLSACETGTVKNASDVVAGLEACLESLIALDSPAVSIEDKAYYKEFLDRLPPTPFYREHEGRSLLAAGEGHDRSSKVNELPQFYPLFPFDRITPDDEDAMEVARETWLHDTSFDHEKIYGWQQLNIFAARVGSAKDALAISQKKMGTDAKRSRFPSFFGPAYDGFMDHNWVGAGMIGVQEMLMQCFGQKIYLLPAWPENIDVDFKLHAPQNTIVEGSYKDGKFQTLSVTPEERRKDLIYLGSSL